jgi:hypothetical protein
MLAGQQIAEALEKRQYSPSALVPVYGVCLDKALALRGELAAIVAHQHTHSHQHELVAALNAAVQRIEKRVQAAVIDSGAPNDGGFKRGTNAPRRADSRPR